MSIILAILALAVMIAIHEWGHFIAGKICKIPVYEFSIGMGPALWKHKGKKETVYSIRALPLGGFCSFDSPESLNNAAENGVTDSALDKVPILQRIFICAAGPFMNILFAFIIVFGLSLFAGETIQTTKIIDFMDNSPAINKIEVNDYIYSIDDTVVYNNRDLLTETINKDAKENGTLKITVLRDDKYIDYDITPIFNKETQSYMLGIYEGNDYKSLPLSKAIPNSFKEIGTYISSVYSGLIGLFSGKYKVNEMSGIVGTVAFMGDYAKTTTIIPFLSLIALISVNLGIMNLLPIPALDGSKILFAIIEAIRKKPINKDVELKLTMTGFAILIGLSVILIISDIIKLFV